MLLNYQNQLTNCFPIWHLNFAYEVLNWQWLWWLLLTFLYSFIGCSVNFEFMNYTIITSQCKGPQYLPKLCCQAFKDFACPYADELNDPSNDCATTMFSYINLYGKYPPGLFASECREGKDGLACPALAPDSADPSGAHTAQKLSTSLLLGIILLLLFQLFWSS